MNHKKEKIYRKNKAMSTRNSFVLAVCVIMMNKKEIMNTFQNTGLRENLIEEMIAFAKKYDVEKLILFGSRARGDYKRKSDIDLAFLGGKASRFCLAVSEDTNTLLNIDVVDLGGIVQEDLKKSIQQEGIVLYEKI